MLCHPPTVSFTLGCRSTTSVRLYIWRQLVQTWTDLRHIYIIKKERSIWHEPEKNPRTPCGTVAKRSYHPIPWPWWRPCFETLNSTSRIHASAGKSQARVWRINSTCPSCAPQSGIVHVQWLPACVSTDQGQADVQRRVLQHSSLMSPTCMQLAV
jgi:hypothetical protein